MKAFQLISHGTPGQWELRDVPEPVPGPEEAVVRVSRCGLNHLDLWLEAGQLPIPLVLPRTPGSEIAGEIAALGPRVTGWKPGDRVAIQSNLFCGQCEFCRKGEESRCLRGELLGVQRDGGFAELVLAPARALVRLPRGLDFETAAALTLAGSTAMHMLTHRTRVEPGQWVLVMGGSSGVGSIAIQIARELGANVIATGSTETKRALALKLGASFALDTAGDDWPAEVRRLTNKRGVDVVVEHVGGSVLEKVFQCLARGATVVTCGATAGRNVRLDLWPFFVKEFHLVGSYGRTRHDLETTLAWAGLEKIKAVIDRVLPLAETSNALDALRARQVLGKILIAPRA